MKIAYIFRFSSPEVTIDVEGWSLKGGWWSIKKLNSGHCGYFPPMVLARIFGCKAAQTGVFLEFCEWFWEIIGNSRRFFAVFFRRKKKIIKFNKPSMSANSTAFCISLICDMNTIILYKSA